MVLVDNQPRETSASSGFAAAPGNCTEEGLPTGSALVPSFVLLAPSAASSWVSYGGREAEWKFNVCCPSFKRLRNGVGCAALSTGQMEHSSPDPGTFSSHRSPRMNTSCGSCAPGTSTSTKRGRCCASRCPGASSTRWISSCSPGDPRPCWRSTTPGAGTTRTKVRSCPWHRLVLAPRQ